jgi:hypothetical protein
LALCSLVVSILGILVGGIIALATPEVRAAVGLSPLPTQDAPRPDSKPKIVDEARARQQQALWDLKKAEEELRQRERGE